MMGNEMGKYDFGNAYALLCRYCILWSLADSRIELGLNN